MVKCYYSFILCLVLLQVPKCFVPVQMFWASPKIWLHLVPLQKLLCRHKKQLCWMQIIFLSDTKCLWLAQYVNKFLGWLKRFGPAQNILGPRKGQGISTNFNKNFFSNVLCGKLAWHPLDHATPLSVWLLIAEIKSFLLMYHLLLF